MWVLVWLQEWIPQRHEYSKDIGLRVQNMRSILGSILNISVGGLCDHFTSMGVSVTLIMNSKIMKKLVMASSWIC
jgi:hypothetical protein